MHGVEGSQFICLLTLDMQIPRGTACRHGLTLPDGHCIAPRPAGLDKPQQGAAPTSTVAPWRTPGGPVCAGTQPAGRGGTPSNNLLSISIGLRSAPLTQRADRRIWEPEGEGPQTIDAPRPVPPRRAVG